MQTVVRAHLHCKWNNRIRKIAIMHGSQKAKQSDIAKSDGINLSWESDGPSRPPHARGHTCDRQLINLARSAQRTGRETEAAEAVFRLQTKKPFHPWCVQVFFFFSNHHYYFPAQLAGGFYTQRSSGQAVFTGVVHSPPRYVPSFLSRIGFSIPTARRFSSNVANPRSRAFRYSIFMQEKILTSSRVHSVRI